MEAKTMANRQANKFLNWLSYRLKSWGASLAGRTLIICTAAALSAVLIIALKPPLLYPMLAESDLRLQDQYFGWRDQLLGQRNPAENIILVAIDEESVQHLGHTLSHPLRLYAELVENLKRAGARVIALDVRLNHPPPTEAADELALAKTFKHSNQIVLATSVSVFSPSPYLNERQFIFHTPPSILTQALSGDATSLGNIAIEPDPDGVVRHAHLVFERFQYKASAFTSLGLRVAEKYLGVGEALDFSGRVILGQRSYPQQVRLNYSGNRSSVQLIPLWRALPLAQEFDNSQLLPEPGAQSSRALDRNPFRDKIVLVGYRLPSPITNQLDQLPRNADSTYLTPLVGPAGQMSAVELQANLIDNILEHNYLSEPDWWESALIVLLFLLVALQIFVRLRGQPWTMLLWLSGFSLIWLAFSFLSFLCFQCMVPAAVPVVAFLAPSGLLVLIDQNLFVFRERKEHTKVFKYLASPRLAEQIEHQELGVLGLEGKEALVTILAVRLENFMATTAGLTPVESIQRLNQCLNAVTSSIAEHNGIAESIWSLGVLAVWGAPLAMTDRSQARLAANCALDIQKQIDRLSRQWSSERDSLRQQPTLRAVFGINTGLSICGRLGCERRTKYGAIGESLDLALSFLSVNRRYGTNCIAGEHTAKLLSDKFEMRELERIKMDPYPQRLHLFELLGHKGKVPGVVEEAAAIYRQGWNLLDERNYGEAERLFNTILRIIPEDRPTSLMLEICRRLQSDPPSADWDGVTSMVRD